jgi:hypothetical protein
VTIELLLLMVVFGMGMTGSFLSPQTRYEVLDLWEPPRNCAPAVDRAETGALVPGKGKATNLSSNIEAHCLRRHIFSGKERPSFVNFVSMHARPQARRSAQTLLAHLQSKYQSDIVSASMPPVIIDVQSRDPDLRRYLTDVFLAEFAAVVGPGQVSAHRLPPAIAPLRIEVRTRPVDMPDLLFAVEATFRDGTRSMRWTL